MKEVFLHYLWRYQKFNFSNLVTTSGDSLSVICVGQPNTGSGLDFSMAQVQIGAVRFAGSVEIHLHSSQWYHHRHHQDSAYDNVILHVVWEEDMPLQLPSGKSLPTLELSHYVAPELVAVYRKHFLEKTEALPCAAVVESFPKSLWKHWCERLYIERLDMRLDSLEKRLAVLQHDWEAQALESNRWIKQYIEMGFPLHSALDSQAVMQLQAHYCEGRHCLKCAIGFHILKQSQ